MKKKLLIMMSILVLSSCLVTSYAADIDSMSLEELKEAYLELEEKYNNLLAGTVETESDAEEFIFSAEGFTYKYLKNEVKNIDGTDYAFLYFEYTNDSGESATPYFSLTVQAFQGGVEINPIMSYGEGVPEAEKAFKDIQSGTTTEIALKYELYDMSPLSIEIGPMFRMGDTPVGKLEIDLNN